MTFPLQFELFGEKYNYHFIFETLAFLVGIQVYYFQKKKSNDQISSTNRLWIMLGAMLGALVGSRLIASFEIKDFYSHFSWLQFYGNKTVLGGFLGGLFGVELFKKIIQEKKSSGDLYVIPILIALFIGRIGCFSMGIAEPTFGIETHFCTGMDLGDGKLRHPVMLYEMAFLVILLLFFYYYFNHKPKNYENGEGFKIFMLAYFGFRFAMEFWKPHYEIFLGLTIIQWSGIFLYLYYWKFLTLRLQKCNSEN